MNQNCTDQSSSLSAFGLKGKPHAFHGCVYGFRQPTLRYKLHRETGKPPNLSEIDTFFLKELGVLCDYDFSGDEEDPILARLRHWPSALLNQANHPVFEPARILKTEGKNPDQYLIFQPCMDHGAALSAVLFVMDLLKLAFRERGASDTLSEIKKTFSSFQPALVFIGLQGFNQKFILKAASELGIQWFRLKGNIFQLGVGRNARWLDSSFTDATSAISAKLARHKPSAAYILHISGLPVPQHFLVRNSDEAIRQAEVLGYPVVIKPADQDNGQGVRTNLQSAQSVTRAFMAAAKFSQQVLVEKHVPGRDYRILVANGEVYGAYERVVGGVTGNGRDAVTTLIERQNQQRETPEDDLPPLRSIAFDEEAKELLLDQQLDGHSVPEDGQWVRLRGACNRSSGGVLIPVPLHQVHPDNLSLALRAARALRLDVAGIDMLIPDIEHSGLDTGASICEVNARPQMLLTLFKPMLVTLFKGGNGRIPVVIIIEAEWSPENISVSIQRECLARGINAGLASGKEVWIGDMLINKACFSFFDGARMLSLDSTVDAMILYVTENQVMRNGWPVEWCDLLLVGRGSPELKNPAYSPVEWLSFAETLCPKLIIMEDGDLEVYDHAAILFKSQNLLNVPCWSEKEEQAATVMRVVNELVSAS
jgi:cyanophycin synthetase